ncbi:fMet-Leu-Phe receptor [Biomphalaria glabrata]|nr:fMet-Leu-Phe receptor [Biomphalaria glabrata]
MSSVILPINSSNVVGIPDEIITDEQYNLIEGVMCAIRGTLAFLGTLGNVVNIYTFVKMGLKDGMTISLLALSISDLAYDVATFSMAASFFCMMLETFSKYSFWFKIEPYGVYIYSGHVSRMPYILSNLTTTYLAVARCLCVAKPISFKNMFGVKLTVYLLITFGVFSVISYLPVLVYMDMSPQYNALINATRVSLWVSPKRQLVINVVWVYRDAVLPFLTQIIISISVFIMIWSLKAAFQFRQAHSECTANHSTVASLTNLSYRRENGCQETRDRKSSKLSGKEYQVLQQVVTISVIYIVCNIPTVACNCTSVIEPRFSIIRLYKNLYLIVNGTKHLFQSINSSVHIMIYLKYNSKFRKTLFRS